MLPSIFDATMTRSPLFTSARPRRKPCSVSLESNRCNKNRPSVTCLQIRAKNMRCESALQIDQCNTRDTVCKLHFHQSLYAALNSEQHFIPVLRMAICVVFWTEFDVPWMHLCIMLLFFTADDPCCSTSPWQTENTGTIAFSIPSQP